jgi:leucyl aminopeptidase
VSISTWDISLESLDALGGFESLCLFVAEDERPLRGAAGYVDWRMCGALSRVLRENFFTGGEQDSLLLPTGGRFPASRIFVLGLGRSSKLDADALGRALGRAAETLTRARAESVAVELPGESTLDDGVRAGALKAQFLPRMGKTKVAVLGGRALQRLLAG